MNEPHALLWTCRSCGDRYRLPSHRTVPQGTRIRCPGCGTLSQPILPPVLPTASPRGRIDSLGWERLISATLGQLILSGIVLTVGIQVTRPLLHLKPHHPALVSNPEMAGQGASSERSALTEEQATLAEAWEFYEAGQNRLAAASLQQLAGRTMDPEVRKLLSRALRRAGQNAAALEAQQEYRRLRAGLPGGRPQ